MKLDYEYLKIDDLRIVYECLNFDLIAIKEATEFESWNGKKRSFYCACVDYG